MSEAEKPTEPQVFEPEVETPAAKAESPETGMVRSTTDIMTDLPERDAEMTLSNSLVGSHVRQIQKWLAVGMYDVREGNWPGRGEIKERIQTELLVDEAQAERLLELSVFDLTDGMDDERRIRKLAILQKQALISQLMLSMGSNPVEMTYVFEPDPRGPQYPRIQVPFKAKITGSQNGQPYVNAAIANLVRILQCDIAQLQGLNDRGTDAGSLSLEKVKMMIQQHTEKRGEQGATRTTISVTKKTKKASKNQRMIEESRAAQEIRRQFLHDSHARQIESQVIETPENDPSNPA